MTKRIFVSDETDVLMIELEVADEEFDVERAIREVVIERCLKQEIMCPKEGIVLLEFFKDINPKVCEENGFSVKSIRKLSDVIIDGKQQVVSSDEIGFHKAFSSGKKSNFWGCINMALELSKMNGSLTNSQNIDSMELLLWGAECTKYKRNDLDAFFHEKINGLQTTNRGGN